MNIHIAAAFSENIAHSVHVRANIAFYSPVHVKNLKRRVAISKSVSFFEGSSTSVSEISFLQLGFKSFRDFKGISVVAGIR